MKFSALVLFYYFLFVFSIFRQMVRWTRSSLIFIYFLLLFARVTLTPNTSSITILFYISHITLVAMWYITLHQHIALYSYIETWCFSKICSAFSFNIRQCISGYIFVWVPFSQRHIDPIMPCPCAICCIDCVEKYHVAMQFSNGKV